MGWRRLTKEHMNGKILWVNLIPADFGVCSPTFLSIQVFDVPVSVSLLNRNTATAQQETGTRCPSLSLGRRRVRWLLKQKNIMVLCLTSVWRTTISPSRPWSHRNRKLKP